MEATTEVLTNWGPALAIGGATIAAILGGIGSILGTKSVGKAAAGVISEKPETFGKFIVLSALPGSQGIYGLIGAFMVINSFNLLSLSFENGFAIFLACLPLAFTALFSGIFQGKVAAAGANIIAKEPDSAPAAIILAVMVETFAILGLLTSILLILDISSAIS
jgi:V/A-type H+-transporting ATPase subunit K